MKTIINHSNQTYLVISDNLSVMTIPVIKTILKDACLETSSLEFFNSIINKHLLYKPYHDVDDFLLKGLETL